MATNEETYDQPLAMTTTNIFEVNHEDAYDSDVDEGPNAARRKRRFHGQLFIHQCHLNVKSMSTLNDNQIFDKVATVESQENAYRRTSLDPMLRLRLMTIRSRIISSSYHRKPKIFQLRSKGRTVADSIAERLTRPTAYKFKTDCSIIPVWRLLTNAPVNFSPAASYGLRRPLSLHPRIVGLVPYTGSDSDSPDEMTSPEHISPLPAISPFICTDSSEAPDSSDGPPLQDPYVTTIARWRSRVTARPSSSHEFPIAPVTAPPRIRRRSATLIRPGEAIPFGRPYRTHLNGPRKLLTARKRVGPLPARRLASRHTSPRSPDHHSSSSSSSSDSSPVHSLGLDVSDQAHSGSSTRDVPPRLCYPPRRAPRRSEAFRRWCAAPLSTLYPPTTSESSSGDSSERPMHLSSHSAGPSRKRCRSPVDLAPLSMPVTRSLAPTRADLSPPRKRWGLDVEILLILIQRELARDDIEEYRKHRLVVSKRLVEPSLVRITPDSSGTRDDIVRIVEDTPVD
ncbi:hypothetical protein Tco_1235846 [Tanacetum coccineum]